MVPDLDTLAPVPWQDATALCLADVRWEDGSDVLASPRQILRRQLARLRERGWIANAGTELEFILFRDTYEAAWAKGYRDLEPANLYNVDYSLLGTARVEPLIRRIRNGMAGLGMTVENSKGECNFGQHEINFRYAEALRSADHHAIYKNGAKEIAAQDGMAITFMAKYDQREGNSCHIHLSLAREDGSALFGDEPALFEHFVAGQIAHMRDLTLFYAPHVNSYKRFAAGSFAPTAVAWGRDNRTCSLRVVGHGPGRGWRTACPRGREPLPRDLGDDRRRTRRDRPRARPRARVRGQRVRLRQAARARHPARRARPLRSLGSCPRRLRRGGGRALPQQRPGGARRLRRGRHRLGTGTRLRAVVSSHGTLELFAPVRSQTAFEETLERIGTAVKLGLLAPGERLPAERELCVSLDISRSTLRQALTALVQSGHLVAVRGRGGGTFVAEALPAAEPPSDEVLAGWRETCDARMAVELGIAVIAADRAEPAAVDALQELVTQMAGLLEDFPAYRQADVRFHIGLAELTGNARLVAMATDAQSEASDLISFIAHPPEVLEWSNAQHGQLLDALRAHDRAHAAQLVFEHLRGTEHVLAGLLP